jgi:hypothetical protein
VILDFELEKWSRDFFTLNCALPERSGQCLYEWDWIWLAGETWLEVCLWRHNRYSHLKYRYIDFIVLNGLFTGLTGLFMVQNGHFTARNEPFMTRNWYFMGRNGPFMTRNERFMGRNGLFMTRNELFTARFWLFMTRIWLFTGRNSVASPTKRTADGAAGLIFGGRWPYSWGRHWNLVSGRLGD